MHMSFVLPHGLSQAAGLPCPLHLFRNCFHLFIRGVLLLPRSLLILARLLVALPCCCHVDSIQLFIALAASWFWFFFFSGFFHTVGYMKIDFWIIHRITLIAHTHAFALFITWRAAPLRSLFSLWKFINSNFMHFRWVFPHSFVFITIFNVERDKKIVVFHCYFYATWTISTSTLSLAKCQWGCLQGSRRHFAAGRKSGPYRGQLRAALAPWNYTELALKVYRSKN